MAGANRKNFDKIIKGLGKSWVIEKTEYKIHPSIAWNHPLHETTKQLVKNNSITPESIDKIILSGMGMHLIGDKNPKSAVDAQFSLPYTVVTTIMSEPLLPELYSQEKLSDPTIRELLSRVEMYPDKEADADFFNHQKMRFSIEIILKNSKIIKSDVEWPKDQPVMDKLKLEKKFRSLAGTFFEDDRVEQLLNKIYNLEKVKDINELIALLY